VTWVIPCCLVLICMMLWGGAGLLAVSILRLLLVGLVMSWIEVNMYNESLLYFRLIGLVLMGLNVGRAPYRSVVLWAVASVHN
jgi:hypothetical protein